ncbi:MltA-interacting protein MipA [compost metagenome]|uniref:MipA/OmpV family protein n=1 Tax=Janthinobacterium sp. RT4P48 TaxID=3424188 RepID=UPI000FC378F0
MHTPTTLLTSLALASGLTLNPLAAVAAEPAAENVFTIGGGVAAISSYSGADKLSASPLIILDYAMANGLFISTSRGIGYGGQAGPFSYSAALGYRGNREDHKRKGINGWGGSDFLKGMGEVKGNASALLSAGYSPLPGLSLSIASDIPLSNRENGANVHFGASGQIYGRADAKGAQQDSVTISGQLGWGERKYVQTMYGVTATQAANTAFKQYTPKGGFYEAQATVNWEHRIDARWGVNTLLGVERRLGDAAKSPIVQRKTSPIAALYVTYRY